MIEKFISIKNIGRFRNCTARDDVTFRKLNLIFAENGQGKTTLCAILRSLQNGQHEFVTERKTLGTNDPASVQIRLKGNTATFSNNTWSYTHTNITIFDSVFIHDNVYSGDYVDHDHKKNLYRVIVGSQGVELAKQVDELNSRIREISSDIQRKKDTVSNTIPDGVGIEDYLNWELIDDVENKIQKKVTEISKRQKVIKRAAEIQSKGLLTKIQFPSLPSDFESILAKELTDVVTNAETRVRQQITDHQMGDQGESWLSQGLEYVHNDNCPFCGQNIKVSDLVEAYRSHFSTVYKELKQEVAQLSQRITDTIGEMSLSDVQSTISGNQTLEEFWKQFVEIFIPDIAFEDIRQKYSKLRVIVLSLAREKQGKPVEPVVPGSEFKSALNEIYAIQDNVTTYNEAIDKCNTNIEEQKKAAQDGGKINDIKVKHQKLIYRKKRFKPEVLDACEKYQNALKTKGTLTKQKNTAKRKLDQYCEDILKTYKETINIYLDEFNTGFRIVNMRSSYRGGTPSSQFQIKINNTPVDLGDNRTASGIPCFKTTLSSGDRSALALAFFLSAIKQDPDITDKIVVLDDPFTSLDRFRRTCTDQLIRKLAATAQQVIILSHDPFFLKLVWDGYTNADIKTLQLCQTGNSTTIRPWDIEAETKSTYLMNYATLLSFYRDRDGEPLNVVRSIRPFLEEWLRLRFPGHFQPNEWLGDFISKIRNADTGSGLQQILAELTEFEAINDYSKKYHHSDSESLSDDELHGFVKRTIRLVGGVTD